MNLYSGYFSMFGGIDPVGLEWYKSPAFWTGVASVLTLPIPALSASLAIHSMAFAVLEGIDNDEETERIEDENKDLREENEQLKKEIEEIKKQNECNYCA